MTRPGPMDWAIEDTWTAGPDIGTNTKLEPPTAIKDNGHYTERRFAPQITNYQLHRAGLLQRTLARMRCVNLQEMDATTPVCIRPLSMECAAELQPGCGSRQSA